MAKSPSTYWNTLDAAHAGRWEPVADLPGVEKITLAQDPLTGHYTRLTRFAPGVDTAAQGVQCHPYPEEVLVLSGDLYDAAFDLTLTGGHYACRPPGERHGPFRSREGCLVLEIAYPEQSVQ